MQRRRARVWVTSGIIGRGVDNVDLVDRVICVLFGWRQSKRRILGAGWIKTSKSCREATIIRAAIQGPVLQKYRAGRIGQGQRRDVGQE
jgi:hypothetical protein